MNSILETPANPDLLIIVEGRRLLIRCQTDDTKRYIEKVGVIFGSLLLPQDLVPSDEKCGMHILLVDSNLNPDKVKAIFERDCNG